MDHLTNDIGPVLSPGTAWAMSLEHNEITFKTPGDIELRDEFGRHMTRAWQDWQDRHGDHDSRRLDIKLARNKSEVIVRTVDHDKKGFVEAKWEVENVDPVELEKYIGRAVRDWPPFEDPGVFHNRALPSGVSFYYDEETSTMSFHVPDQQKDLFVWWMGTSWSDYEAGAPKVDEYGAHDIEIMGAVLAVFLFKEHIEEVFAKIGPLAVDGDVEKALTYSHDKIGREVAVWFYILGKVARLVSDYLAQRPGKPDTWHDITFYSMMARRIQKTGRWP